MLPELYKLFFIGHVKDPVVGFHGIIPFGHDFI